MSSGDLNARKLPQPDRFIPDVGRQLLIERVEAVLIPVAIQIELRALLRRDRLLDVLSKDLPEGHARSDIDVGHRNKAVAEVLNSIGVETAATLIRVSRVLLRTEDAIEDDEGADSYFGVLARLRTEIDSETEAALRIDIGP